MYILIKNQEGENMNLLSQNTDFNALLAAMKADIEAEYEKATGSAINLDEDSGSDYEVGINVEDSAAEGFCLASFLSCSVPLRINFLISGELIPMNNI